MEKKEYLTEENYEKGKKTLAKIIKIVLTVGLSLSLLLVISGIIVIATSENKENDKKETTTTTTYSSKVRSEDAINADIKARADKISTLKKDLPSLKAQKNREFHANGFSQKYYELEQKISDLEDEISKLESEKRTFERELSNRESDLEYEKNEQEFEEEFNSITQDIEPEGIFKKGIGGILIAIGLGLIPPTLMISGMLFLIYKKREITIFTTQQTMPIAKEGIEKMAPTIGDAAGSIAKGITKGIKEGKEDSDK